MSIPGNPPTFPQRRARAVAVSGGPDSMALLHRLAREGRAGLVALTVDHGLRPEAALEAAGVAAWCKAEGIAHRTLALGLDPGRGNVQARARIARYRALIDFCLLNRISVLSLAHHADDQMETFVLRQAKGSAASGLACMAATATTRCVEIERPLLGESKADLAAYCRAHRLPVSQDPGNANPKFDRARVRAEIAGWTDAQKRECLARIAGHGHARREREAELAAGWPALLRAHANMAPESMAGTLALDRAGLLASGAPEWYLARALAYVRQQDEPFSREALRRLLARAEGALPGAIGTLGGVMLRARRSTLWLAREPGRLSAMPVDSAVMIWDRRFVVRLGPEAAAPEMTLRGLGSPPRETLRKLAPGLLAQPFDAFPAIWRQGLPALYADERVANIPVFQPVSPDFKGNDPVATFCPGRPLAEIFTLWTNYSSNAVV